MGYGNLITLEPAKSKRDVVTWFYNNEDDYFFRHIHKAQSTKEACIEETLNTITSNEMILVYVKDELAAFFVRCVVEDELVLEGFHVSKEYRTKNFLTLFWQKVKVYFGKSFKTGVYCKNEPAIKTLLKADFKFERFHVSDENQVFLIFKS